MKILRPAGLFVVFLSLITTNAFAKEYIVKLKSDAQSRMSIQSIENIQGIQFMARHVPGKLIKIDVTGANPQEEAQKLQELAKILNVEYAVPNLKVHTFAAPNDPQYSQQWALAKINAEGAWNISTGSKKVVVGVIDTGADLKHEDLMANLTSGFDFINNNATPQDITSPGENPGHGTHVSGIIGAVGNNGIGICGINQTATIMPLRFLDEHGSGDLFSSTKAIDYAIANGVQVINASWGATMTRDNAKPLIEAIQRASDKGIIFVAAAANDGSSNDTTEVYPANVGSQGGPANTISVAASDASDAKPSWSNYGRGTVDLASPGDDILSTLPGNTYGKLSGTSMAAPLVTGIVALMKSVDPTLTGEEVRSILQSTGAKVNIETACNCRVDVAKALQVVKDKTLTVVPAAKTFAIGQTQMFSAFGGTAPYTFTSSSADVGTISDAGLFTAVKQGSTTVKVTDSTGSTAESLMIYVGAPQSTPTQPPAAACPYQNKWMCDISCTIDPTKAWCPSSGTGTSPSDPGPGAPPLPTQPPAVHP